MPEGNAAVRFENLDGRLKHLEGRVKEHAESIRSFEDFTTTFKATEVERDKQQKNNHEENKRRLEEISIAIGNKTYWVTLVGAVGTLAGLLVMAVSIWVMVILSRRSHLDIPDFFRSYATESALSSTQQMAIDPSIEGR